MRAAAFCRFALVIAVALAAAVPARAAQVESFSPQGEVKSVRQVVARFSAPMVAFGDPRLDDPMTHDCAPAGGGRWADTRTWVYDFEEDLPGGVRCAFAVKDGLRALDGEAVTAQSFVFTTGGPAIAAHFPERYEQIDEGQIFVLALNAPVRAESIASHAWCEAAGIEERIDARLVEGKARDALLAARSDFVERLRYQLGVTADKAQKVPLVLLQCRRRLPAEAAVRLVWGPGIEALSGVATTAAQVLEFKVRSEFVANFSCPRVRRDADCLPVAPMELRFSAPVARATLERIRLRAGERSFKPRPLDRSEGEWGSAVTFDAPFPEQATLKLDIPGDLRDDAGRRLANQKRFPLIVVTDAAPPLAKFPARFGIVEAGADAAVPVTLRNLEPALGGSLLQPGGGPIAGGVLRVGKADARTIAQWLKRVRAHEDVDYVEGVEGGPRGRDYAAARSILTGVAGARHIELPKPNGARAFEVVGIPLPKPGFYVLELASPRLGAALLTGSNPKATGGEIYHVSTAALVTNLAVHLKHGAESSLVWVTTLDTGAPAAHAQVSVQDCTGREHWRGVTDADGIARIERRLPGREALPPCLDESDGQLMAFARLGEDTSFVMSRWDEGIARWRFNLPGSSYRGPVIATSVLDRSLLRAADTLHMKHFYRQQSRKGFRLPKAGALPAEVVIEHSGTEERYRLPVKWDAQAIAESEWSVPREAKTGLYRVVFEDTLDGRKVRRESASFRVEEFRVPLMRAAIEPDGTANIRPQQLALDLQVSYLSGGGASNAPVRLRGVVQPRLVRFGDYDGFAFLSGPVQEGVQAQAQWSAEGEAGGDSRSRALASVPLTLDEHGGVRTALTGIPQSDLPQEVLAELEYADPNGEVLTTSRRIALWPAAVALGIKPDAWARSREAVKLQVVAVDPGGHSLPATSVTVTAFERRTFSHRKRLLGGFYAYESGATVKRLRTVCEGETDARGLLFCEFAPPVSGELLLEARTQDAAGNAAVTHTGVWVAGEDDWWFEASNDDRMDVIPERKRYEPGDKAVLQVRMPFRRATALVSVEREGVMESFVTPLSGKAPVIEVPMHGNYAPNVFVSVLAVRGRVGDVQPTALVDLGKPAFRMGIAEIEVGWREAALDVKVSTDKSVYRVRDRVSATIEVTRALDGMPPVDGEVALAAIDEGLLELAPNDTWKLLDTMMRRRGIDVDTATASMQVVGKRHYGRKAREPGGGGGRKSARELFDTLLMWKGRVKLDAQGRATVDIPLNDSLSSFRIVAVASAQAGQFGTGQASVRSSQPLMLFSGLPPMVREQDVYSALYTVRNAGAEVIEVQLEASTATEAAGRRAAPHALPVQQFSLEPGAAREVSWETKAPAAVEALHWQVVARSRNAAGETAEDSLRTVQKVAPAVPVRTVQAVLAQLTPSLELPVRAPTGALAGRGGVRVDLAASLVGDLPGVREYMSAYPFTCLEQLGSQAIALRDRARWSRLMDALPGYLDSDGFARYFAMQPFGSDVLTAYLLSVAEEAGWPVPQPSRARMQGALERFVSGQITRAHGWRAPDLSIRKIAALQALARIGRSVTDNDLASITIEPNQWPTSALIDWLDLLARAPQLTAREERRREAEQLLRARLDLQGSSLHFSTERGDLLWWLMVDADVNANRLLLGVLDRPEWQSDLARLVRGSLGRRQRGHWGTTVANAWGVLAMEKFAAKTQPDAVTGSTHVSLAQQDRTLEWRDKDHVGVLLPWPGAGAGALQLTHEGQGRPWAEVQSLAAIPLEQALVSGYRIRRSIAPVVQREKGRWSRGDVVHVRLDLDAQSDMTWVVVRDPIPAGATVLGSGLGRDSRILDQRGAEAGNAWPLFEERRFDAYHVYFDFVPKGTWSVEYSMRLNNPGEFQLPPTRVEALYLPEMFGELPNARMAVGR